MLQKKQVMFSATFDVLLQHPDHATSAEIVQLEAVAMARLVEAVSNLQRIKNVATPGGSYSVDKVKINNS